MTLRVEIFPADLDARRPPAGADAGYYLRVTSRARWQRAHVAKCFDDGSDVLLLTAWQFTTATAVALPVALTRWAAGSSVLYFVFADRRDSRAGL